MMHKSQRLDIAFDLSLPDRPPILGGWLASPEHIQTLTGCSEDEYWSEPFHWGLEAERVLGTDGLVTIFQPIHRGEYRCIDGKVLEQRAGYTVDALLAEIDALPDLDQVINGFDAATAYEPFKADFQAMQARCGDMVWCPADWNIIPKALWYHEYGYETAFTTLALYPDRYRKLIRLSAEKARQLAILRARAIREGISPKAFLTGEDLCSQQGPMASPQFLRREYFPLLEYAIEPLLAVGAKLVWHCDGNYRPLLDDVLACGFAGLQGFQSECGMDLEWIVERRTRSGDPLIIFGPMSVTTTMPYGTSDDVRAEVHRAMRLCRDKASLIFFTSNTITPDVPFANLVTLWQTVQASEW